MAYQMALHLAVRREKKERLKADQTVKRKGLWKVSEKGRKWVDQSARTALLTAVPTE